MTATDYAEDRSELVWSISGRSSDPLDETRTGAADSELRAQAAMLDVEVWRASTETMLDGTHRAAWWIAVPVADTALDAIYSSQLAPPPKPVEQLAATLASAMPELVWKVRFDHGQSDRRFLEGTLAVSYRDLFDVIEPLVKPLCDPDAPPATVTLWGNGRDDDVVGTHSMPLWRIPSGWAKLHLGVNASAMFESTTAGRIAARFGITATEPLLVLPELDDPTWFATLDSAAGRTSCVDTSLDRFGDAVAALVETARQQ